MARGYDSVRIEQNLEGRFQVYVYRTRSAGLGDLRQFGQRIPALEYAMDLGRKTGLPIDDRTEKRPSLGGKSSQEASLAKHRPRGRSRIERITKAYIRTYSDSGQVTAYAEWIDQYGKTGRTEGKPGNAHMQALFARAKREGVEVAREVW